MLLITRSLLIAAALVLAATTAPAQVVRVPNTGCANSTYPTHDAAARVGQTFTFGYTCDLSSRRSFAILGVPNPSGGIPFQWPLTCAPGPCLFLPAPIGGSYLSFDLQFSTGSWSLAIPNDPGLAGTEWALQCACYCT
jgi:hypothetical protein